MTENSLEGIGRGKFNFNHIIDKSEFREDIYGIEKHGKSD